MVTSFLLLPATGRCLFPDINTRCRSAEQQRSKQNRCSYRGLFGKKKWEKPSDTNRGRFQGRIRIATTARAKIEEQGQGSRARTGCHCNHKQQHIETNTRRNVWAATKLRKNYGGFRSIKTQSGEIKDKRRRKLMLQMTTEKVDQSNLMRTIATLYQGGRWEWDVVPHHYI